MSCAAQHSIILHVSVKLVTRLMGMSLCLSGSAVPLPDSR